MPLQNATAPFLKSGNFLRTWHKCEAQTCTTESLTLSLDRAPPPLPLPLPVRKPAPLEAKIDPEIDDVNSYARATLAMVNGVRAVHGAFHALQNPPPPPPRAPAATRTPPAPKLPVVPPFDIQDIPGAMRKVGMPMGAKLMERWFKGELNYSPTDTDEKAETNQNGLPYPPSMIDTTSITMKWVQTFLRAKTAFDTLTESLWMETPRARKSLATALMPYKTRQSISP